MTTETREPTSTALLPLPVRVHSMNNWGSRADRNEVNADNLDGPITVDYANDDIVRSGHVIAWVGREDGVRAVVQMGNGRLVERHPGNLQALEAVR